LTWKDWTTWKNYRNAFYSIALLTMVCIT
jgi:hypothetical protein